MKTATTMLDIFDFLLVKVSASKKLIGPWGQKIAILNNKTLAAFARLRCASSVIKVDPESLDLFSYVILWEPDQEQLKTTLASINRGGKLVVVSSDPLQSFKLAQQNSRAVFAQVEKTQLQNNKITLYYVTVYSVRANKQREFSFSFERLHRSIGRAKFDNVLKREYNSSNNFVSVGCWNNAVRSLFLAEHPTCFEGEG